MSKYVPKSLCQKMGERCQKYMCLKKYGGGSAELNSTSEINNSPFWNLKIRVNLKTSEFGRISAQNKSEFEE